MRLPMENEEVVELADLFDKTFSRARSEDYLEPEVRLLLDGIATTLDLSEETLSDINSLGENFNVMKQYILDND